MPDSFQTLFRNAREGDRAAREQLLAEHLPGLRAFVRIQSGRALRAREAASDLVQTVCREALADLDGIECESPDDFRRWIYTVAMHKVVRKAEYHTAEKRAPDREVDFDERVDRGLLAGYASICTPSRDAASNEEIERIESAIDELPDDYREIIVQARLLGMSYSEIAQDTGKNEVAVRKLLSRARARLALLLEPGK